MLIDNHMIFEISKSFKKRSKEIDNSIFFIIDNFYKNPYDFKEFILKHKPEYHKSNIKPSYNGIYFHDMRHKILYPHISHVYDFLGELCNQKTFDNSLIITNFFKFEKCNFNDYKKKYWWPHLDGGYTGIVYLNENDKKCGTNLYYNLDKDNEPPNLPEHFSPWRCKNKYKIIKKINPRFNRMVLFEASKFFHGMNICNDMYSENECRLNQVFFSKINHENNFRFK